MIRARVTLAVFSLVLVTVLSGCEQTSPAASSQTPPGNLAARVKALEDLIPSPENSRAPVPRIVSIGQDRLGVGITPGA